MEPASQDELIQRQVHDMLAIFLDRILPNVLSWLVIASLFIAIGVLIVRGRSSMRTATVQLTLVGVACAAVIAFLDFWQSFGEAFTHGVDRYRAPIHFGLTALAFTAGIILAYRRRRIADIKSDAQQDAPSNGGQRASSNSGFHSRRG